MTVSSMASHASGVPVGAAELMQPPAGQVVRAAERVPVEERKRCFRAGKPAFRCWGAAVVHVLQRASVDDGLKSYVSAQRGSNKH